MAPKKLNVNESLIKSCLPDAPKGYSHSVVQFSARVFQVFLHHPDVYTYSTEPPFTIWGFVKTNGDVMRPTNATKPSREVVCSILDAGELSPYTTIVPTNFVISD